MEKYKKWIIGIFSLILLILLINIGLNVWIKHRLPEIITEKNKSPYEIVYDDIEVSLLTGNIFATDITIVPKKAINSTTAKAGLYANVKSVEIIKFKIFDLLFTDKLRAKSIRITKPEITIYKDNDEAVNDSKNIRKDVEPFRKVIVVSDFFLVNGLFQIVNVTDDSPTLKVSNLSLELTGIVITDDVLEQKVPFSYENYVAEYDSLFYRANKFYNVETGPLRLDNTTLESSGLKLIPKYSKANFVKAIPVEKDLFAVSAKRLLLEGISWGFKNDKLFVHCGAVKLDQVIANIYRPKMPPDDLTKKPLYSKLIREIPIDIRVDTLAVRDSNLQYEEEKSFEKGPGQLSFTNMNIYARNITNGFGRKTIPDVIIKVNSNFMGSSPLEVDWRFNVLDRSDSFTISGKILKFPAENLTPFIKPYMNVTATGMLDQIYFTFKGNDVTSSGQFALEYDDLKVNIYQKKEKKKKNKVLSAIANLFVKNDTKERIKETDVEVERIPEKSFFNFFWRNIAEGLKKLLI